MAEAARDRLADIVAYKHDEVAALKHTRSFASLDADARAAPPARPFAQTLLDIAAADGNGLICEMKRKSPSAGDIRPGRDAIATARAYEAGGAACISVLTDGPSFGGSLEDMTAVRDAVRLPVLRKDFMIDPIQIAEARAAGADAILLIMASLSDDHAAELHACADGYGLSVLVESHDRAELERALRLPSPLMGINNRNLKTMATDLGVTEALADMVDGGRLLISESGVRSAVDVARLRKCGARSFLVGESLMRAENAEESVRSLVQAR